MQKEAVSFSDVCFRYHSIEGETLALDHINLDIQEGEFIGIVGPSGCGKSTLLSLVSGLITPTSGEVTVRGVPIRAPSQKVAYMLQQDQLFPWRTIYKNALLGLEIQKKVTDETKQNVDRLLNRYGLGEFRNAYPRQLSGGMRQRAALIRTLAVSPDILLLDEPFSALDYQTRLSVSDEIAEIIKKEGKTALLVTHDISEAISMSDRILVLSKRPATVKAVYHIDFSDIAPLERRKSPLFSKYFNEIWKELDEK